VIIHQNPVILTRQAIVLVNIGFGEYNGADGSVIMGVPNHQEGGGVEDSQPWERGEDEW
jgi:hypothetical protein